MPLYLKDKEALAKGRAWLITCGVGEKNRREEKREGKKKREVGGLQIAERRQLHVHRGASSGSKQTFGNSVAFSELRALRGVLWGEQKAYRYKEEERLGEKSA